VGGEPRNGDHLSVWRRGIPATASTSTSTRHRQRRNLNQRAEELLAHLVNGVPVGGVEQEYGHFEHIGEARTGVLEHGVEQLVPLSRLSGDITGPDDRAVGVERDTAGDEKKVSEADGVGVVQCDSGAGRPGTAVPRGWMRSYRCLPGWPDGAFSEMAIKAGLAGRQVQLAERQGALIEPVLTATCDALEPGRAVPAGEGAETRDGLSAESAVPVAAGFSRGRCTSVTVGRASGVIRGSVR
jgi:hypothetical protein